MTYYNPEIFREYDIRGVADKDLPDSVVEMLGRAFAEYLRSFGGGSITVGHDARLSSPRIKRTICNSIAESGCKVVDIGLCPTPALYFSLYHLKPDAGIMITGSHNPAEFNGFKLCIGKDTIFGEEIQKIRKIMESMNNARKENRKSYEAIRQHPIIPDYINELKNRFDAYKDIPITVVLDSGNGTAGLAAPHIIRSMGCDVLELFSEPDGHFPNHHPDPTIPKNLSMLIETVRKNKADLGIAFDGDADRIGVVDEKGNILWGDQLMVIFSRDILAEKPGATFVSEVKCSQTMYDDIRSHGGNAVMWKTGHSLIKNKMKQTGASLAGEMSGHLFFADRYFGFDDAIYAACRVVELLKKNRKQSDKKTALSELLSDLPKTYTTPEIRFDCPDNLKFKVVERMKELYAKQRKGLFLKPREIITVDGVRAVFDMGWGLIRASNTQPVLVMRFESIDQESLNSIKTMMESQVSEIINSLKSD